MINRLNFFNVKQNTPVKMENVSFKALIPALEADTVEFTNPKKEVIKKYLNQLDETYSPYLPKSVIKQGKGLIEELLENTDTDKISDKYIELRKNSPPYDLNDHFMLTIKNLISDIKAEDINNKIKKKYFKQMPLNLFKKELLVIANKIILDQENPQNLEILKQIRHLGLSPEEQKWTQKIESDFNLTLTPFNDANLLKRTYEELAIHKECFKYMPDSIDMISFIPRSSGLYSYATYSLPTKEITINSIEIFKEKLEDNNHKIMERLKHELGHHIDNQTPRPTKIDFNRLLNQDEMDYLLNGLTPEHIDTSEVTDKQVKKYLDTILRLKVQDESGSFNTNIFQKVSSLYKAIDGGLTLKGINWIFITKLNEKILSPKTILAQSYNDNQIKEIKQMLLDEYGDNEGSRSFKDSMELIAYAFAKSTQKHPSPQLQEVLDIFGMPELTDRCVLPENHPVLIQMSKQ